MGRLLGFEITRLNAAICLVLLILAYILFTIGRCSSELKLIKEMNKDESLSRKTDAMILERAQRNNLNPIYNITLKEKGQDCEKILNEETSSLGTLEIKQYCVCASGSVVSNGGCPKGCSQQNIPKSYATVWKNKTICAVRLSKLVYKPITPPFEKCSLGYRTCTNSSLCVLDSFPCPITSLWIGAPDARPNGTYIGNFGSNATALLAFRNFDEAPIVKFGVSLNGKPCFDVLRANKRANGNINIYNVVPETSCGDWGALGDDEVAFLDEELELDYLMQNDFDKKLINVSDYSTNISFKEDKMQLFSFKKVPINTVLAECQTLQHAFEGTTDKTNSLENYRKGIIIFFIVAFSIMLILYLIHPIFYYFCVKSRDFDGFTESFILVVMIFILILLAVILNAISVSKIEDLNDIFVNLEGFITSNCYKNQLYNKIFGDSYKLDTKYIADLDKFGDSNLIFGIVMFAVIILYFVDIFGPNMYFDPPADIRVCEEIQCNSDNNSNSNNNCGDCACEIIDCFG